VSVLGVGAYVVVNMNDQPKPIGSATQAPSPRETATDSIECSAPRASGSGKVDLRQLPDPVKQMRESIIEAATFCDYDELERLALIGKPYFSYTFGEDTGAPADFWRAREREALNGSPRAPRYMAYLVEMLDLPFCKEIQQGGTGGAGDMVIYEWPRAHCSARTHADWQQLKGLYTQEQIDQMEMGDLYVGFRVGILEDGDWVYFIAGD
jgi:hypothetical protein